MAEDQTSPNGPAGTIPPGGQIQVRVDDSKQQLCYANAFRVNITNEEVILDLGLNEMLQPNAGQAGGPQTQQAVFHVGSRVVLSYPSAKRLMMRLAQVVQAHEQRFGEVSITGPRTGGESGRQG